VTSVLLLLLCPIAIFVWQKKGHNTCFSPLHAPCAKMVHSPLYSFALLFHTPTLSLFGGALMWTCFTHWKENSLCYRTCFRLPRALCSSERHETETKNGAFSTYYILSFQHIRRWRVVGRSSARPRQSHLRRSLFVVFIRLFANIYLFRTPSIPPPPPSPHKLASLTATMNIRQRKAERHKEALQKLSQEGGNRYCFDCEMRGPLYVVSDFNILVCSSCSAVHRSFQHKVKGITMSEFNEDEMARFMLGGNDVAKKVWHSTFRGKHPRSGDVLALKDFIRGTFIDRRYCDQIAYDKLIKSWENPQAALAASSAAASPPPSTTAATTTLPRLPASAGHRTLAHPATSTAAPQRDAPPPSTETAAPAAPLQPAQNDVFDDLFAAPVQAPVMPHPQPQQPLPSSSAAAAATAPAMTTTMAPPPPAPPKVSSLVDDLFGGVPASAPALPTSKPTSGYSSAQSQPFPSFGGPSYPPPTTAAPEQTPYMSMCANQAFSSGVPQQPPQQQQQMPQQQFYGYAAPSAQASYANQQNAYDSFSNPVSSVPPTQQQQQQYSGYNAAFGAPPIQMPGQYVSYNNAAQPSYSVPQQQQQQQPSHPAGFNAPPPAHGTHANDPFKNLGDPSVFAHLGGPSTASQPPAGVDQGGFSSAQSALPAAPNTWGQPLAPSFAQGEPVLQQTQPPASQIAYSSGAPTPSMNTFGMPQADASGQGWAAPPSNAASSPNRSRIVVLSVTKSGEPPSAAPSMWQQ
jgi:hypothetical protein